MRTYKNAKGDHIEVSDEHLDAAISIKEELQKLSPTRRTSWAKHKQMMAVEGFDDSDTNESYRCLIKSEQKKRGTLTNAVAHVDIMAENKLRSIKEEIGAMYSAKLELQEQGANIRRLVRSVNKDTLLIESIGEAMRKKEFVKPTEFELYKRLPLANKQMIVCLSDIHYGALVDIDENFYDKETCKRLLNEYADKVCDLIIREKVEKVHIVNLGDVVENAYLRNQSLFGSEETLSEQIVNISHLIIEFINRVLSAVPNITYAGIAGNHDRVQGDKNSNLHADHVVRISNTIIEMYAKHANTHIEFINTDSYIHLKEVNGFNFAFVHGDRHSLKKQSLLAELSSLYETDFSAVIGGHIHHYTVKEVGQNKYQVTFGSIKGIDDYSIMIGAKSSRSQGVILVSEDNFEIRKISL